MKRSSTKSDTVVIESLYRVGIGPKGKFKDLVSIEHLGNLCQKKRVGRV